MNLEVESDLEHHKNDWHIKCTYEQHQDLSRPLAPKQSDMLNIQQRIGSPEEDTKVSNTDINSHPALMALVLMIQH
jgi:hypothetical protein